MMCSKVIYTGMIKTEIGNWNSDGYFHRACAICDLGGKSRKNLVEHQIIKMIRKLIASFVVFSHPIVKITHSACYMGPYRLTISKLGATNSQILEKMRNSKLYVIKYLCTNTVSHFSYAPLY